MRNTLQLLFGLAFALLGATVQAQSPVAMVLSVGGEVTLDL